MLWRDTREITTIVTHDSCADGLASAMILRAAAPRAEVIFLKHGTRELAQLPAKPGMLFCDIAPPADRVLEFVNAGASVLDHHKTAREVVAAFGDRGVFADEAADPGVSGALLAYWATTPEFANAGMLRFAELVGICDTWQRQDPRWDEALALQNALVFWPREKWFAACDSKSHSEWEKLLAIGPTLVAKREEEVTYAIRKGSRFTVNGIRVLAIASPKLTSSVVDRLHDEVDLVVGFDFICDDSNEKVVYSLRSHTDFDCAAFAKSNGGGGHRQAASFVASLDATDLHPYELFRHKLA